MKGNCLFVGTRPIGEILAQRPKGTSAIFEIIKSRDEYLLGAIVRISRRDRVIDVMTEEALPDVKAEDLKFLRYVLND